MRRWHLSWFSGWRHCPPTSRGCSSAGSAGGRPPNSQYAYFKDGNSYYGRADDPKWDNSNKQTMGYNAAQTAGIQTSGVLDYQNTYDVFMKIIGRHLGFLASTARSLGLPREKIFVHTIAQGVDRYNMDSQFNADSNPSPSFYGEAETSLRTNASFIRCVQQGSRSNMARRATDTASSASARRTTTLGIAGSSSICTGIPIACFRHSTTTTP